MQTKRLVIRKFKSSDIDDLFALLSDANVMRYMEAPYSYAKCKRFLEEAALCEEPLIYAVERSGGDFAGYIIYHPFDAVSYEIGWVLLPGHWGNGYAQELTEALIEDARHKTSYLVIECSEKQPATIRIASKNNFQFVRSDHGLNVYRRKLE